MTYDLKTALLLSLDFEAAKQSLMAAKSVRELVDAWWADCNKFDDGSEPRKELQAIYDKQLAALGITAAA